MLKPTNSATSKKVAKAEPGSPEYKPMVAEPVMRAVDGMPKPFRECVHDIGYIPVYHAWRKGLSPMEIRRLAALRALPHMD